MTTVPAPDPWAEIATELRRIADDAEKLAGEPAPGCLSLSIQPYTPDPINRTQPKHYAATVAATDAVAQALLGKAATTRRLNSGSFHHDASGYRGPVEVIVLQQVADPAEVERLREKNEGARRRELAEKEQALDLLAEEVKKLRASLGTQFAVGDRVWPKSGGQILKVVKVADIEGSNPTRQQFWAEGRTGWLHSEDYQLEGALRSIVLGPRRPAEPKLEPVRCVASLHVPAQTADARCFRCGATGVVAAYEPEDPTGQLYTRVDDGAEDPTRPGVREPMHTGAVTEVGLVDETETCPARTTEAFTGNPIPCVLPAGHDEAHRWRNGEITGTFPDETTVGSPAAEDPFDAQNQAGRGVSW